MYMQETSGCYKHEGVEVKFTFSYPVFDVNDIADEKVRALAQRQSKVDAGNKARAKAQSANGHSKVVKQTESQKAESKLKRQADKVELQAMKALLASQGVSTVAELQKLI
jgi:hypothetical protein